MHSLVLMQSQESLKRTNQKLIPYIKKFLKRTSWKPKVLGVFAGKIDYPKYNFFDKQMIRLIMWITKGPTDPKKLMNLQIGMM